MSIDRYRDIDEDLSDIENNGDSISLNQSEQELQNTSHESGSSGNRDSPVWPYFEKEAEGKLGIPICKICKKEFSKSTATSSLARHLNIHNIVALKQGKKLLNPNPHLKIDQQERTNLVVRWIVCDLQPFSVVEGEEWRDMISKFDPRYQFPSRNTIKNYIMDLFQNKQYEVKATLNKIPGKVAFTSDMWTALNGTSFLSLTIHYVDSNWKLKNFLLDIIPIKERHTGININNAIINTLEEHFITEKTLALTTDNASSMVLCGSLLKVVLQEFNNSAFSHYRCAAHVLNLAVCRGVDLIDESVVKVRSLMSYIKALQPTINDLKKLCDLKSINYLAPELDIKTRWNSTYYMLEKWKKMKPILNMLAADDEVLNQKCPDEDERIDIKDTLILLEPIERVTQLLSASSYPTHGDIRFVFLAIQDHLSQYKDDKDFSQKQVANAIYQKLDSYWPILNENSQISALLDPRTKLTAFKSIAEKTKAINMVSNFTGYSSVMPNPTTTFSSDLSNTRSYFRQLRLTDSQQESNSSSLLPTMNCIRDELEMYLALPLENDIDPLVWWQEKQRIYPRLSLIARDYLCIQATSVASEQAFSIAGQTITPARNRLDSEVARAVLCLKSWIKEKICN